MRVVEVEKRKLDGARMRWAAYVVEVDELGTWLFTPHGSIVVGERDDVASWSYVGVPENPGLDVLHLAPSVEWWFGAWAVDSHGRRLTIDICRPPVLSPRGWSFEDLELDLWCRGGEAGVADLDEFDEACDAGLITGGDRAICLATATRLRSGLGDGSSPFDEVAWDRLAHLAHRSLASLTPSSTSRH